MSKKNPVSIIKFFRYISYLILLLLLFLRISYEIRGMTQCITMETMVFAVIIVILFSLIE